MAKHSSHSNKKGEYKATTTTKERKKNKKTMYRLRPRYWEFHGRLSSTYAVLTSGHNALQGYSVCPVDGLWVEALVTNMKCRCWAKGEKSIICVCVYGEGMCLLVCLVIGLFVCTGVCTCVCYFVTLNVFFLYDDMTPDQTLQIHYAILTWFQKWL